MDMDAQQGDLAACSEEGGEVRCPLWRQVQQEARVMVSWVFSRVFLRDFSRGCFVNVQSTEYRASLALCPCSVVYCCCSLVLHSAASGRRSSGRQVEAHDETRLTRCEDHPCCTIIPTERSRY